MAKPKPIPTAELVAAVAEAHECSQEEAYRVLGSVQSAVQHLLAEGKVVHLSSLATFSVVDAPERQVRNPATGEMQTAAPTRQARVTATRALKVAVKEDVAK